MDRIEEMSFFQNAQRLWESFSAEVKYKNRYYPNNQLFSHLDEIIKSGSMIVTLYPDDMFYRARIRDDKKCEPYPVAEMGAPPKEKTKNGRLNPQGISYLYLSGNENTCIAETRPQIEDIISIGIFNPSKHLQVIDLPDVGVHKNEFYSALLACIGSALNTPINIYREDFEYYPMQNVAEFLKTKFDGIRYVSSVNNSGENILIFDPQNMNCIKTYVRKICGIRYRSTKIELKK